MKVVDLAFYQIIKNSNTFQSLKIFKFLLKTLLI